MKLFLPFVLGLVFFSSFSSMEAQTTTDFNFKLNPNPAYLCYFTNIHKADSFYISIGSIGSSIGGNKVYKHDKTGKIIKRHSYPLFLGNDYYWGSTYFVGAGTIPDTPYTHSHGFMSCIDYNLDTLWTKEYTGLNQAYQMIANYPIKIKHTPDGGFLVLGTTILDSIPGLIQYPYFMKTDQFGNLQWFKIYYSFPDVRFFSFELTGNMGIIVNTNINNGSVIKMSALGNIEKIYNYNNYPYDLGLDYFTDMSLFNNDEVILVKVIDLNGNHKQGLNFVRLNYVSWQKKVDTTYDFILYLNPCNLRIFDLPNSDILIAGSGGLVADSSGWNPYYLCQEKGWFYTIDSTGDSVNFRTLVYDTCIESQHYIHDVELTDDGGLVGCGYILGKDTSGGWYFKISGGSFATSLPEITENSHELSYRLFPNPANNRIVFEFNTPIETNLELVIYDAYGRKLKEKTFPEATKSSVLYLDGIQAGVYFYQIWDGRKMMNSGKFIKL